MRRTLAFEIARPPSAVFAYLIDPANLPGWQSGITSVRADPDGLLQTGSRIEQAGSIMGIRLSSTLEVTELEPDRRLTLRATTGSVPFEVRHLLEAVNGETQLTVELEGEPEGLPISGSLLARAVERKTKSDFGKLKQILESDAGRAA